MDFQGTNHTNPFFDELSKYPGRFVVPVLFADSTGTTNNGSGFFLSLGERTFAITCHHVVAKYRERASSARVSFQFGPVRFLPDSRVVSESKGLDIAVFDVTDFVGRPEGIGNAQRIVAPKWPPGDLAQDDIIGLAGFPGSGRERHDPDYFRFYNFSAPTLAIESLHSSYLYTKIELDASQVAGHRLEVVENLAGLSGGPVFAWRLGLIRTAELVGMVTEYQQGLDLLYVRRLTCLRADGTLDEDLGAFVV